MKHIFAVLFSIFLCNLVAQGPPVRLKTSDIKTFTDGSQYIDPTPFLETIKASEMKALLDVLASDEFEGRETGTVGNKKAAQFIAEQFRNFGLPQIGDSYSYFQKVSFTRAGWNKINFVANEKRYKNLYDYFAFPSTNAANPSLDAKEITFLGYGIDDQNYSDYKGVNVSGKVLMIYSGEPKNPKGEYLVSKSKVPSEWGTDFRKKVAIAHQKGAKAVILIDADLRKKIDKNRNALIRSGLQMGEGEMPKGKFANNLFVSPKVAKDIIGKKFKKVVKSRKKIEKKGVSKAVKLPADINIVMDKNEGGLKGDNVLGYIEGTDPKLKDELVIITAHYDHLGIRGNDIYNGADDNGSGTSTVIEVAQALTEAKKAGKGPRRSVLVMLVTGEEKGLLGSKFYTEFPIFPLSKTVANINVDMVGRIDKKYKDNGNYVYVIGADRLSTELHTINETVNANYTNLILDYKYNEKSDPNRYYYRSDHYNFAEKGIPAIFYFNGTHDDYHMTTDTAEKIDFEKMENIGKLVFLTAWELANRDKRIEVDVLD